MQLEAKQAQYAQKEGKKINSVIFVIHFSQVGVDLMLANFSKPTETKPALFDHDEVGAQDLDKKSF